jgi:hypothetical protein
MLKATKIQRDKDYGCWSVQLLHEESGRYYWMDVSYDEGYRQIDVDWNQYIFYLADEDDLARKAFQENCDNFEAADSEVYWTLLREGELKDTDDGYLEIAVENWQEKIWEIRQ